MEQTHDTPPAGAAAPALQGNSHFKGYFMVGAVQMLFVVFMVAASFVHFQHSRSNVLLVLLFAVCNAACVASISMHLKSEKWIIYRFLVITLICVCALFLLTAIAFFDRLKLN